MNKGRLINRGLMGVIFLSWSFLFGQIVYAYSVNVCYHYGCKKQATVTITEEQVGQIQSLFDGVTDAQEERVSIQKAILQLYLIAGEQTPIFADKAGNFKDGTADGRMDCVDHSETDTYFLKFLSRLNLLQFHEIMKPYYRAPRILDLHYASRIKEKENGQQWVVDTWFYDFGHEPVVLEADKWRKGWYPEGW